MSRLPVLIAAAALAASALAASAARADDDPALPHLAERAGRHALIVDGRPFLVLGAQVNNSSGWPAVLPQVWPAMGRLHVNTVEVPVYWEQFEPEPGRFDPSVVDALLAGAREHHLRLVLLWFGTWKNGSNHYVPAWVKRDPKTYPNAVDATGAFIDSPSPFAEATLAADAKAFAALMAHLKAADPQHTVLMVQVENETGMWGSTRDHSPVAERAFNAAVPPEALAAMGRSDAKPGAGWADAFGRDAAELFEVWSTARYVGQVAAAGKAAYPLPMYVNASVRDVIHPPYPPTYQVGGPNDNVIPLWRAAAPAVDVQSPDIYDKDEPHYLGLLDAFSRHGNPLFVPETIGQGPTARFFYAALGRGAIGYSPFGLDDTRMSALEPGPDPADRYAATAANYEAIAPMAREIAALSFAGKLQAAVESDRPPARDPSDPANDTTAGPPPDAVLHWADWDVRATFGTFARARPTTRPAAADRAGRVLVAELDPGEFLVTGQYARLDFRPTGRLAGRPWQYLKVEEGRYADGTFVADRILNGDQTDWGVFMTARPTVVRVSLYTR